MTKNNISHNWCNVESELENIVLELDRLLTNMKIYDGVSYILDNKIIENTFIIEAINNSGWGYINCSNQNVRNMIFKEIDKTVETNPIIKKERKEEFIKRIAISLYTDLIGLKNLLKKNLVCATNAKPSKQLNNGKYELVTYNYTNIFEKHYSNNCREIYHIHGSVMDEIVLGIDSKVEFNNEVFNMFDKSIQRTELNENGNSLEDFVINSQDIGYIGLSFDENDYTSMFQILSYEGSKHTVFYYNNEDRINKANNIKKILGYEVFNDMMNKNKLVFENINRILIA